MQPGKLRDSSKPHGLNSSAGQEIPVSSDPVIQSKILRRETSTSDSHIASQKKSLSLKNRILLSTLFLMTAVLITIAVALQFLVFPQLQGDSAIIRNLKLIHFTAALVILGASWIFIEFVSKKITLPLRELTKRADEISKKNSVINDGADGASVTKVKGDEIQRLRLSFNRMLDNLLASEAGLRESEAKYRFLFDNGPSPIFVIDAETLKILDVNARAAEEYQYSKEELLSMTFTDLSPEMERAQTIRSLQKLQQDVVLLHLLKHRRKDGSIFMVNYQAGRSKYLKRPAIIAAVWDVTGRLEQYARVIQAGKMATLGEMATGIAHELNQPLNVMKLACDYMMKKIRIGYEIPPHELAVIARECNFSVERASKIINHLRQFGRKAEETMSELNVNDPINSVFQLLGRQLESRGIAINLELMENLPVILGDSNRLEQVFINLLINARDALIAKKNLAAFEPFITIRTYVQSSRIIISIEDNGPGIPAEIQNKIFEPFFTTKNTGEGTGLGLSISYGIINEHRGTIELESSDGHGTKFIITFPQYALGGRSDENSGS